MSKYNLINCRTKEEYYCDKVTINGFDYFVIENAIGCKYGISKLNEIVEVQINYDPALYRGIICTNNPNIDIPKVVDEVAETAYNWLYDEETENKASQGYPLKPMEYGFIKGYNKSQELHPFSEEDVIEFYKWVNQPHPEDNRQPTAVYIKYTDMWWYNHKKYTSKEIIQIWQEQQIKTLYYE